MPLEVVAGIVCFIVDSPGGEVAVVVLLVVLLVLLLEVLVGAVFPVLGDALFPVVVPLVVVPVNGNAVGFTVVMTAGVVTFCLSSVVLPTFVGSMCAKNKT